MGFLKPSRKQAAIQAWQAWQEQENARIAREQAGKEAAEKKAATEAQRVAELSAAAAPGQGSQTVASVRGFTAGAGAEGGADMTTAATVQTDAHRGDGVSDPNAPTVLAPGQTDGGTDLGGVTSGSKKRRRGIVGLDI